jgi:hypothetical protein
MIIKFHFNIYIKTIITNNYLTAHRKIQNLNLNLVQFQRLKAHKK